MAAPRCQGGHARGVGVHDRPARGMRLVGARALPVGRSLDSHPPCDVDSDLRRYLGHGGDGASGRTAQHLLATLFPTHGQRLMVEPGEGDRRCDNGGLVLASPGGPGLLVGVRPTNLLTFHPPIYTAHAGRSWSTGLLTDGLAARPDALAADSASHMLALVNAHAETQVLSSTGGPSRWQTSVTTRALASTVAGRSCGLSTMTAVAFMTETPLAGASCSRPGVLGIFAVRAGAWRLLQAPPPSSLARDRLDVLALQPHEGRQRASREFRRKRDQPHRGLVSRSALERLGAAARECLGARVFIRSDERQRHLRAAHGLLGIGAAGGREQRGSRLARASAPPSGHGDRGLRPGGERRCPRRQKHGFERMDTAFALPRLGARAEHQGANRVWLLRMTGAGWAYPGRFCRGTPSRCRLRYRNAPKSSSALPAAF